MLRAETIYRFWNGRFLGQQNRDSLWLESQVSFSLRMSPENKDKMITIRIANINLINLRFASINLKKDFKPYLLS